MTPAAEALLAGTSLAVMAKLKTAAARFRSRYFFFDQPDGHSQSSNLGIPRPIYGLAEDCHAERHEWRGN